MPIQFVLGISFERLVGRDFEFDADARVGGIAGGPGGVRRVLKLAPQVRHFFDFRFQQGAGGGGVALAAGLRGLHIRISGERGVEGEEQACRGLDPGYVWDVQTTLNIDPRLLVEAEQAAAQIGKPLSSVVEDLLKLFLNQAKPALQTPPGGYRGGSLDRDDPFFSILARIEEERHARLPRDPVPLD